MILTFCWVEKGNEKLDHAVARHSGGNSIKTISSAHGSTAQSYSALHSVTLSKA